MTVSRRRFLAAAGALAATALASDRLLAAAERHTPALPDLSRWSAVRAQFSLTPRLAHLSSFFFVSHPRPVAQAIDGFRRALDENPFTTTEHALFGPPEANLQRAVTRSIAAYLGGSGEDVALTANTTTGLALVYHGLALAPGDELLLTTHDHYSHHESARLAAARAGAVVRRIALYDDPARADAGTMAERLRAAIGPRTRAVGVTWVHSSTGVRLPLRALAAAVAEANRGREARHGTLLIVDGVHGFGAVDETIAATGVDVFCAGTHKWMFAPRGTGIVWARPEAWARLSPMVPTFSDLEPYEAWMADRPPHGPTHAARVSPGGFVAYEHQWAMSAAVRFHEAIGRARVAERIHALNGRLKDGLAAIRGVTVHTPRARELSAGITCFEVAGRTPEAVVARLLERGIVASTSPYRVSYPRLAPGLVNDEADVDRALVAVRDVART